MSLSAAFCPPRVVHRHFQAWREGLGCDERWGKDVETASHLDNYLGFSLRY